ncbi:MAG TPA: hypothetical protein VG408_10220 [Actinomycetota bacterium]|nr:hypothetical protein [Actinomycetota bacterium]
MNDKLLSIYLNDHLAGATAGVELAKRALSNNEGTAYGTFLTELVREIDADRATLQELIKRLGFTEDRVKETAAWIAEKIGRLKLNGQLMGYSPLSRLIELEGLRLGVEGKLCLWRTLSDIANQDSRLAVNDFDELIRRAETQIDGLEKHRLEAANEALS